jgi:hypothetical protein
MGDRLLRGSGGGEAAIDILTLELMELMLKVRTIYVSADGVLPLEYLRCALRRASPVSKHIADLYGVTRSSIFPPEHIAHTME